MFFVAILVIVVSLFCVSGVICNDLKAQCQANRLRLWDAGRTYCIQHEISFEKQIDPKALVEYIKRGKRALTCPKTGERHPTFSVFTGPICLCNKHKWEQNVRRIWQKKMLLVALGQEVPYSQDAILDGLRDDSALVRKVALTKAVQITNAEPEIIAVVQNIAETAEDEYTRKIAKRLLISWE